MLWNLTKICIILKLYYIQLGTFFRYLCYLQTENFPHTFMFKQIVFYYSRIIWSDIQWLLEGIIEGFLNGLFLGIKKSR